MSEFKKHLRRIIRRIHKMITPTRLVILGIIILIILWQVFKKEQQLPMHIVDTGVVERVVIASGRVELSDQVSLAFQESGRISRVNTKSGAYVQKGQLLAQLDLGTLSADLRDAKASLAEAQYRKDRSALDSSLRKDVLTNDTTNSIENLEALRKKLLSSDLELLPEDNLSSSTTSAPIISGTYNKPGENARFVVSIYSSNSSSGYSARVIGGGIDQSISLSTSFPTSIADTGLFIQLPDSASGFNGTDWVLELPNTRSASYASNLYQYLEAKKNYENALKNQSKEISLIEKNVSGYTEYDIAIERARASIDRVNQQIRLRGIYAPISGTIGRIDLKAGQQVSGGTEVITILGTGKLEAKLRVPESSVGAIHYDDPVIISPDIDPGTQYKGTIASIDQAETYLEGTPVYETKIIIDDTKTLRPGMTVRGKITTSQVTEALRIPELALFENGENQFIVRKAAADDSSDYVEIPVTVVLRGTDGLVAITGDISAGDSVILKSE